MTLQRLALGAIAVLLPAVCAEMKKPAPEPRLSSIYPAAGQQGRTYAASIRGTALATARAVRFSGEGVRAKVVAASREEGEGDAAADLLQVEVAVDASAAPGAHAFRVVTELGVTNEISLHVVREPVTEAAGALNRFPAVVNGRISRRGEIAEYWINARAGEALSFEARSGTAAFDPAITLLEPSGSWFDAERLNPVAAGDEPLFFPGLSTDARLVHRFERAGRYCLQVSAFGGQGGPDYAYYLRITPGASPAPVLHPKPKSAWDERFFPRHVGGAWIQALAGRGGGAAPDAEPEIFRAAVDGKGEPPLMSLPGIVEGRIQRPAEVHAIRLKVDQARDVAIEIETPAATLPRFNPVLRVVEPGGSEFATNVYTKLNNNGLYMMKMIQAKMTVTLRVPGEYRLELRDITTDRAGEDFAYRVLIRPQTPHLGRIDVVEDHLNLQPGEIKPLTVNLDREEEFKGYAMIAVEGLPPGVTAVTGVENPPDKPPLPNAGRLERYIAKPQTTSIMLMAAPDAPLSEMPADVRVVARPVVDGKAGAPIQVKQIPVMVVARRPS